MRHSLRLFIAFIPALFLILTTCDSTEGPTNVFQDEPTVSALQISPSELFFTEEDGVRDTLVTFQVSARSELPENYNLVAVLASLSDREQIDADTLVAADDANQYSGTLSVELETTDQRNLVLYVYASGPRSGIVSRTESVIKVRGTTSGYPVVLSIDHPDTVFIPPPGDTNNFAISAEVTHSVSISLINRVSLDLYDKDDNHLGNFTFNMEEVGRGANHVQYAHGFEIDSENSPDSITVQIYAVDNAGTHSDTLRSHFTIAR